MTTRPMALRASRGFYGIGIQGTKIPANLGTLWRTAQTYGASFIFTIGRRYSKQPSDTMCSARHVPLYTYDTLDEFYRHLPHDCHVIGVELDDRSTALETFTHPQRCVYLLGSEDRGLSAEARARCQRLVQLPGEFCLNVAVAGSIVLFHRYTQRRTVDAPSAAQGVVA